MSATYVDLVTPRRDSGAKPATVRDGRKYSNGQRAGRNAYPSGEGSAPLSNAQKARLCVLARAAYEEETGHAAPDSKTLEAWRREQQQQAVGKSSLTTCTQGDYNLLLAHFAGLAGETGVAMNAHVSDATAGRRLAMHKLTTECAARGLTLAYPTAICRSKYTCGLDDANATQLWKLFFDVRSSKHPRAAKEAAGATAGGTGPLPAKLSIKKAGTKPAPVRDEDPF